MLVRIKLTQGKVKMGHFDRIPTEGYISDVGLFSRSGIINWEKASGFIAQW